MFDFAPGCVSAGGFFADTGGRIFSLSGDGGEEERDCCAMGDRLGKKLNDYSKKSLDLGAINLYSIYNSRKGKNRFFGIEENRNGKIFLFDSFF